MSCESVCGYAYVFFFFTVESGKAGVCGKSFEKTSLSEGVEKFGVEEDELVHRIPSREPNVTLFLSRLSPIDNRPKKLRESV